MGHVQCRRAIPGTDGELVLSAAVGKEDGVVAVGVRSRASGDLCLHGLGFDGGAGIGAPAVFVTTPVRMSVVDPTWAVAPEAIDARRANTAATAPRLNLGVTVQISGVGGYSVGLMDLYRR
jgi:hypothetical protein